MIKIAGVYYNGYDIRSLELSRRNTLRIIFKNGEYKDIEDFSESEYKQIITEWSELLKNLNYNTGRV